MPPWHLYHWFRQVHLPTQEFPPWLQGCCQTPINYDKKNESLCNFFFKSCIWSIMCLQIYCATPIVAFYFVNISTLSYLDNIEARAEWCSSSNTDPYQVPGVLAYCHHSGGHCHAPEFIWVGWFGRMALHGIYGKVPWLLTGGSGSLKARFPQGFQMP